MGLICSRDRKYPVLLQEPGWNRAGGAPRGQGNNLQLRPYTHGENPSYNKRTVETCVLCEDTAPQHPGVGNEFRRLARSERSGVITAGPVRPSIETVMVGQLQLCLPPGEQELPLKESFQALKHSIKKLFSKVRFI